MTTTNTKKNVLFLAAGGTLPTPPTGFIETTEKLLITPVIKSERYKRNNGQVGSNDAWADTEDATAEVSFTHMMRSQNKAGDALDTIPPFDPLLLIGGFEKAVNTTTPGEETVTYTSSQTLQKGSAVYYLDGKKTTMTDSISAALDFDFTANNPAMINATMSTFLDNKGLTTNEANPLPPLLNEETLMVSAIDVTTVGGTVVNPKSVKIDFGAEIAKRYGMGIKQYDMTDYAPTITIEAYQELDNNNDAINALVNQDLQDIVIKLNTVGGVLTSGKSLEVRITNCKQENFTDADDEDALVRTIPYLMTGAGSMSLKMGFFS